MKTKVVTISEAQNNLEKLTDDVIDHNQHLIIKKSSNKDVIVISEKEYRSWQETMFLFKNKANRKYLLESLNQVKEGKVRHFTEEEWNDFTQIK